MGFWEVEYVGVEANSVEEAGEKAMDSLEDYNVFRKITKIFEDDY